MYDCTVFIHLVFLSELAPLRGLGNQKKNAT